MLEALAILPCVPPAIRDQPLYVGDHVIRHYRGRHLAELERDLAQSLATTVEIVGGIGVLRMTRTGNEFTPAANDLPSDQPRPALTADEIAARQATCRACPGGMYEEAADRCRMCGCGGIVAQRTASRWATCPRGYWHA